MKIDRPNPAPPNYALIILGLTALFLPLSTWSLAAELQTDSGDAVATEFEIESQIEVLNLPLESGRSQFFKESSIEATLKIDAKFADKLHTQLELSANVESTSEPNSATDRDGFAELNQLWLQTRIEVMPGILRVGLQELQDERGWWWDSELWAATFTASTNNTWHWTMSAIADKDDINTTSEPKDPERADIYRLLLQAGRASETAPGIYVYGLITADLSETQTASGLVSPDAVDEQDASFAHFGVGIQHRTHLMPLGSFDIRADFAVVTGTETRLDYEPANDNQQIVVARETNRFTGWAFDAGFKLPLNLPGRPNLAFGYAFASGTARDQASGSRTFRQTGIHDNNQNNGLYGTILKPELSNLSIFSAALIFPVADDGALTLSHHSFSRVSRFDSLPENEIDLEINPGGTRLGHETGLYLEYALSEELELEMSLAYFKPGTDVSLDVGSSALRFSLELSWEF